MISNPTSSSESDSSSADESIDLDVLAASDSDSEWDMTPHNMALYNYAKERTHQESHLKSLFRIGFGHSRDEKVRAADAYRNGTQNSLSPEEGGALFSGRLGAINYFYNEAETAIQTYQEARESDSRQFKKPKLISKFFGGSSKAEKLTAAQALEDVRNGTKSYAEIRENHKKALTHGKLKKIAKEIEMAEPFVPQPN